MKKIQNRQEANYYFDKINSAIERYLNWKMEGFSIPTKDLIKYLKANKSKIIKDLEMSDVGGIDRVYDDVVGHLNSYQADKSRRKKIMTFESFLGIDTATHQHEKILADYFNVSVDHIDLKDSKLHIFEINDFGRKVECLAYNKEELENMYNSFLEVMADGYLAASIEVGEVTGFQLPKPVTIGRENVMEREKLLVSLKDRISFEVFLDMLPSMMTHLEGVSVFGWLMQQDCPEDYFIWVAA